MTDPITVFAKVAGGNNEDIELAAGSTVADLREALGLDNRYSARSRASGNPVSDASTLTHMSAYVFAKNLEGGAV